MCCSSRNFQHLERWLAQMTCFIRASWMKGEILMFLMPRYKSFWSEFAFLCLQLKFQPPVLPPGTDILCFESRLICVTSRLWQKWWHLTFKIRLWDTTVSIPLALWLCCPHTSVFLALKKARLWVAPSWDSYGKDWILLPTAMKVSLQVISQTHPLSKVWPVYKGGLQQMNG